MTSNLASARRQYGTGNTTAPVSAGGQFFAGYGRKTGARIDGRVQRKTMMGGASQGPISSRPTRSESMLKEAEAALDAERQKGIARARAEAKQVSAPVGDSAKPKGQLIPGSAPGSSIWVNNDSPLLHKKTSTSPAPAGTTQGTVNGQAVSRAPAPATGIGLLDAVTGADGGAMLRAARQKKAAEDRAKGRAKARGESSVRPLQYFDRSRVA